jgi:hypothetical protein
VADRNQARPQVESACHPSIARPATIDDRYSEFTHEAVYAAGGGVLHRMIRSATRALDCLDATIHRPIGIALTAPYVAESLATPP